MKRLAIFASGKGSNAGSIIRHFASLQVNDRSKEAKVVLVVSNKPTAGVLDIAAENRVASLVIEKEKFFHGNAYADELKSAGIDMVVLAGFLWKIPPALIQAFPQKVINIHPALLPKYGGKGMYGRFVHEAVIANKETESGITIHYVDELYDHGRVIFQAVCPVYEQDTPESLGQRVNELELIHYPAVLEQLIMG